MPTKLFRPSVPSKDTSTFVQREFVPRTFPTPSAACSRQRGLFENTATPTGAGQVLNGRNQAPFAKQAFPACD